MFISPPVRYWVHRRYRVNQRYRVTRFIVKAMAQMSICQAEKEKGRALQSDEALRKPKQQSVGLRRLVKQAKH